MGRDRHDVNDDDFEFDEEYFNRTYRPLSNLPTPPLSSRNSSAVQTPDISVDDEEYLDAAYLGPAIHLVNLLPPAASLATPSVPLVQALLTRANLPLDTIALAVCILDSLSSKFSRHWRLSCPLAEENPFASLVGHAKRHTLPATPISATQLHIDAVHPEIIVLAALVIANKFTEDLHEPTHFYAGCWGREKWTCAQINVTERCIMESLDYRIVPLMDAEIIADARSDMQRAAKYAVKDQQQKKACDANAAHARSLSAGVAVMGLGFQLTPVTTPPLEEQEYPIDAAPAKAWR